MIDGGDLRLALLELSLGVKQVIDRWHKIVMMHLACQIARESCEKAQSALTILGNEDSQHLASAQFNGPIGSRGDIPLHLLNRHERQRMRLIAERAGELLRQLQQCCIIPQQMKFAHHQVQNYYFYHPK